LEYCDICESAEVKAAMERELEKFRSFERKLDDKAPADKATVDRVRSAKERLKAFQETRNK
jgi:hypothetical protein